MNQYTLNQVSLVSCVSVKGNYIYQSDIFPIRGTAAWSNYLFSFPRRPWILSECWYAQRGDVYLCVAHGILPIRKTKKNKWLSFHSWSHYSQSPRSISAVCNSITMNKTNQNLFFLLCHFPLGVPFNFGLISFNSDRRMSLYSTTNWPLFLFQKNEKSFDNIKRWSIKIKTAISSIWHSRWGPGVAVIMKKVLFVFSIVYFFTDFFRCIFFGREGLFLFWRED